jgi:adenine-specific DNA methylase
MAIETDFDVSFIAKLTAEEKQIQQNYRPVIGVHKWFARRPGALFRGLLLSEFTSGSAPLREKYFESHSLKDVTVADPFMGGGTSMFEASRIGCNVLGLDINPMAFWVVRQELCHLDRAAFLKAAEKVLYEVENELGNLYTTRCTKCNKAAQVKYFFWVKQTRCGGCKQDLNLFPGYLIAGNSRHTHFVLHCPACKELIQVKELPAKDGAIKCHKCQHSFEWSHGTAKNNRYTCGCGHDGKYPAELRKEGPPRHHLFGMEYFCYACKPNHDGRFFKTADEDDLSRFRKAEHLLQQQKDLPIPEDEIPDGDETKRLHRWGYKQYREMFNDRQLLSLGLLLKSIMAVKDAECRHALATVFSDSLRYQNMLCRYDEYALKCQDIFAVHGFPVGLIECENNPFGIPKVGSGGFRHFVEKYLRAKRYCEAPFETCRDEKGRKHLIPTCGERIDAALVASPKKLKGQRSAFLAAGSIEDLDLQAKSLDAVFTDPPYFDNVQYAELMDFCFAWLRQVLKSEMKEFGEKTTRTMRELTGNLTMGRDLAHFTEGLSSVFSKAAAALKPGAPLAFTYHHNDIEAYGPVGVAILDAGLACTATLACPAEMTASLHINGTGSSVIDSIIVCRKPVARQKADLEPRLQDWLSNDRRMLQRGGVKCTQGDLLCLAMGHLARCAVNQLRKGWRAASSVQTKLEKVTSRLKDLVESCGVESVVFSVLESDLPALRGNELLQPTLFD